MQNKQYIHTNLLMYCSKKFYTFNQVSNNESESYIILNTSREYVNYEGRQIKVPMNKPCNIQNTNICNGIFHISFSKALLINEGERESGRNDQENVENGMNINMDSTIAGSMNDNINTRTVSELTE